MGAPEGDTADVGEDVVGDDQRSRQEEPDHAFEDAVHDEVCLDVDEVESHVGPGELGELETVVPLLQRTDEEHEAYTQSVSHTTHGQLQPSRLTYDIEHEANKTVMGRKRQEHSIDQDYVLEVVDDAFPVEKIHGCPEEIPI